MSHSDSEPKGKDAVYYERNVLALAFIASYVENREERPPHGWCPDFDAGNGDEWAIVWVDTHENQVGWHIPVEMIPDWLPKRDPEYDGYTTDEKNGRMDALVYG